MSEERRPYLPETCIIHADKLDTLVRDMRDVKTAVCGNEALGIHGLVRDVEDLKEWRRKLDLRVAGIAGGVSVVALMIKRLFDL